MSITISQDDESGRITVAAVRLRATAGKRYKKVENATALIWKLLLIAEQTFRRLNARLRKIAGNDRFDIKIAAQRRFGLAFMP